MSGSISLLHEELMAVAIPFCTKSLCYTLQCSGSIGVPGDPFVFEVVFVCYKIVIFRLALGEAETVPKFRAVALATLRATSLPRKEKFGDENVMKEVTITICRHVRELLVM